MSLPEMQLQAPKVRDFLLQRGICELLSGRKEKYFYWKDTARRGIDSVVRCEKANASLSPQIGASGSAKSNYLDKNGLTNN